MIHSFILGNPRSGTSLLRLMLNHHSSIVSPPESGFAHWWLAKYSDWSEDDLHTQRLNEFILDILSSKKIETWKLNENVLKKNIELRKPSSYADIIDCVYISYVANPDAIKVIVDKNNYYIKHLEDLERIWRDAKFIHLIRDGRDVACSYLEVNKLDTDSPYKPRLPLTIQQIAEEWQLNVMHLISFQSKMPPQRFLLLKYEDLISNSVKALSDITSFLEVPFEDGMLQYYHSNDLKKIEPIETMAWKMATKREPDKNKIGRYKFDLSEDQTRRFTEIAEKELSIMGYEL